MEARGLVFARHSWEKLAERPAALDELLVAEGVDQVVHLPDCPDFLSVESDPRAAARCETVNTGWMDVLAAACARRDLPLLQLSTSLVFDGSKKAPYTEEDPINPRGRYGAFMAQGEQRLRAAHERHVIVRTDWIFGARDVDWFRARFEACRRDAGKLTLLDRRFSPTPAADVARVLLAVLLQVDCRAQVWGTYHYCALQPLSEAQLFESLIREAARHDANLAQHCEALEIVVEPVAAPWIANSSLNAQKLMETFGIKQRSRAAALTWMVEELCGLPHAEPAAAAPVSTPAAEPAPVGVRERKRKKPPRKGGKRSAQAEEGSGSTAPTEVPAREAAAKKP